MELRFLKGDFGNIKYKLQSRPEEGYVWTDVPCVEEQLPKCPCGVCRKNDEEGDGWYCQTLVVTLQTGMHCPNCGNKLSEKP